MKRIIATAMTLALAVGLASAAEVTSGNIVGYKTMTLPASKYTMLSLNWVEVGTANDEIAINDLFSNAEEGASLRAELAANANNADQILVWNGVDGYKTYYYRRNTATILGWANFVGNAVTTDKIPLGTGFWFLRNGTTDANLTFAAQVNTAGEYTHVLEASTYSMIGSGYSANMPLNDARWDWATDGARAELAANANSADQILVWNGVDGYKTYYYRKNTATILGWANFVGNAVTTDSLPLGTGAWYLRNGTSAMSAGEIKPY